MRRVLAVGCVLLLCGSAIAATPQEKAQARAKVTEARQQYNLSDFAGALKAYQEVYKLTDDPTLLFNIGQCQWKLGDDKAAIHAYRAYLRSGVETPNRAMVEARILELEKKLNPEQKLPAQGSAPMPSPDAAAPVTPAAPADAGVAAEPAPLPPTPATLSLPAPSPAPARPTLEAASSGEERPPVYTRWWFWTAVGAAVAGGIALALVLSAGGSSIPSCPEGASCGEP